MYLPLPFPPTTLTSNPAYIMIFRLLSSMALSAFLSTFFIHVQAQEFRPAVVPLSVKSPYLNSWLKVPPSESKEPQNIIEWPQPWTVDRVSPEFRVIHSENQLLFRYWVRQDFCALTAMFMSGWGKPI